MGIAAFSTAITFRFPMASGKGGDSKELSNSSPKGFKSSIGSKRRFLGFGAASYRQPKSRRLRNPPLFFFFPQSSRRKKASEIVNLRIVREHDNRHIPEESRRRGQGAILIGYLRHIGSPELQATILSRCFGHQPSPFLGLVRETCLCFDTSQEYGALLAAPSLLLSLKGKTVVALLLTTRGRSVFSSW